MVYYFGECVLDEKRYELHHGGEAEHCYLTVLCAEFVDVRRLADHCDPEEFHAVVQASHTACTEIIHTFEGYSAHYLSAGLVAYFGRPQAHEDDVQRSIRAGLRMVKALENQPTVSAEGHLTVRIGIHSGPVVVGEIGGGRRDPLAVGETLTIAARLKDLAEPGMVVISATTARLVEGYFLACNPHGQRGLLPSSPLDLLTVTAHLGDNCRGKGLCPALGYEHYDTADRSSKTTWRTISPMAWLPRCWRRLGCGSAMVL